MSFLSSVPQAAGKGKAAEAKPKPGAAKRPAAETRARDDDDSPTQSRVLGNMPRLKESLSRTLISGTRCFSNEQSRVGLCFEPRVIMIRRSLENVSVRESFVRAGSRQPIEFDNAIAHVTASQPLYRLRILRLVF